MGSILHYIVLITTEAERSCNGSQYLVVKIAVEKHDANLSLLPSPDHICFLTGRIL